METTVSVVLIFLLSWPSFWPFHHKPKHPPTPPELIAYELVILNQTQEALQMYPKTAPDYLVILQDLQKLQEPIDSPTFQADFDKLENDINALGFAIEVIQTNEII